MSTRKIQNLYNVFKYSLCCNVNTQRYEVKGATASVWRVINDDEGLLHFEGTNDCMIWFHRSHLACTRFRNVWSIRGIENETFHFAADLIWASTNGDSWYEATALWDRGFPKPVADNERIGRALQDYRPRSVFTAILQEGQKLVLSRNVLKNVINKYFSLMVDKNLE